MPVIRKMRIANPHRKNRKKVHKKVSARRKGRRGHKRNPLGSEVLIMANPKRKRSRRRTRKSNPTVHRKRKHNTHIRRKGHRRSNPSTGGKKLLGFDVISILKLGAGAAAGSVATRGVTQMVLQDKNTGAIGYGSNIGVGLALSWLATKFLGKEVGTGVAAGSFAAVMLRIYTEHISQTSPNLLSGMGDVEFSDNGLGQYLQDGDTIPFDQGGKWTPPQLAAAAAAPQSVVSGGGRFSSRF